MPATEAVDVIAAIIMINPHVPSFGFILSAPESLCMCVHIGLSELIKITETKKQARFKILTSASSIALDSEPVIEKC